MKVFKYPLATQDYQSVDMPSEAQIISAQVQDGKICLWAMVDPTAPISQRTIRIAGTGHALDDDGLQFIGTVQMYGGSLILHVFEVLP